MVFAIIAIISAFISIAFTREKPLVSPPGPVEPKEDMSLASIKKLFTKRAFLLPLIICFISMGIFNAFLTLIEAILVPRGISSAQAGIIGAVFVVAGIIGAVVLPIISDKLHVRTPFFVGVIALLIFLYLGLTFIENFVLLVIAAGITGFSIMGVAPILFQYGTEAAYPIQEGTSLGVILLMGQISGILFIYLFEVLQNTTGTIVWPMLLFVALTVIELPMTLKMKETYISAG